MPEKKMLVAICGLEGAGKTSAMATIKDVAQKCASGRDVTVVREPGGTPMAEALRALVKSVHHEQVSTMTDLLLMYASRKQVLTNVVNPALERGDIVLSDRFWGCSYAYQCFGSGAVSTEEFWSLHHLVMRQMPEYALVIYLDIDPRVGLERARGRGALDAIEQRQISFFDAARRGYQQLALELPQMKTVDASKSQDEVCAQVRRIISDFLTQ